MKRLQRLRYTQTTRDLVSEVGFNRKNLIQPIFVAESVKDHEPIIGLDGIFRYSIERARAQIESYLKAGILNVFLFAIPGSKQDSPSDFCYAASVVGALKETFSADLNLFVDTCLCSTTSSGHCCIFGDDGKVKHTETLAALSAYARACAESGADFVCPSDMQDGTTAAVREILDRNGLDLVGILSYSTKFASSFYGPFRNATGSAPQFGDRKSYQIDFRSRSGAIASSLRNSEEGADLLLVKPGMTSFDLITPIAQATGQVVGAYHVSGEYAALKLLAKEGLCKFEDALREHLFVLRRAGAGFVITYGAHFAERLGL